MKKIILTGIKPTGLAHLGNYLGAIRPALSNFNDQNSSHFLFIADYHAYTMIKDAKIFNRYVLELAATWLACGLDPKKVTFYRQMHVPEVFELTWLLSCHTPKGDMNRAHAYKALVQENQKNGNKDADFGVNIGLFTYPILMAADILLFDANIVPVGKDQIQHVEIARSIAKRINVFYKKDVFVEPLEWVQKSVQTVPGTDGRKMSKSYNNTIPLFVTEKKLQKLINKLTTDSSGPTEAKQTENSLVFEYYKLFAEGDKDQIVDFKKSLETGMSWGAAKAQLFEVINDRLKDSRDRYDDYISRPKDIEEILRQGGLKARQKAIRTMQRVRNTFLGVSSY